MPDLGILVLKEYSIDSCARLGDCCVEEVMADHRQLLLLVRVGVISTAMHIQ